MIIQCNQILLPDSITSLINLPGINMKPFEMSVFQTITYGIDLGHVLLQLNEIKTVARFQPPNSYRLRGVEALNNAFSVEQVCVLFHSNQNYPTKKISVL